MKILFVGDTHSNTSWVENHVLPQARRLEVDAVFQVGDFGYRPEKKWGKEYLEMLKDVLPQQDFNFYWIDGNHENFDWLDEIGAYRSDVPVDVFTRHPSVQGVPGQLVYIPRGFVWQWGDTGLNFLAMGGAHSPDKQKRSRHVDWWPQEKITPEQMRDTVRNVDRHLGSNRQLDVLVSHDCPAGINVMGEQQMWQFEFPETYENRKRLKIPVDLFHPRLVVHGHYHVRYHTVVGPDDRPIRVEGLSCDENRDGMALLNTNLDSLELQNV